MEQAIFNFLFVCILLRLIIVLFAKIASVKYLKYLGYLIIIPALGSFYVYFSGIRDVEYGTFNNKIWWGYLRPVHGILYLLFSYNAINGNRNAWVYLLLDVLFSFLGFINFHFIHLNLYIDDFYRS
jgi:hypothetical protein